MIGGEDMSIISEDEINEVVEALQHPEANAIITMVNIGDPRTAEDMFLKVRGGIPALMSALGAVVIAIGQKREMMCGGKITVKDVFDEFVKNTWSAYEEAADEVQRG